jgi:hypothetical protein
MKLLATSAADNTSLGEQLQSDVMRHDGQLSIRAARRRRWRRSRHSGCQSTHSMEANWGLRQPRPDGRIGGQPGNFPCCGLLRAATITISARRRRTNPEKILTPVTLLLNPR